MTWYGGICSDLTTASERGSLQAVGATLSVDLTKLNILTMARAITYTGRSRSTIERHVKDGSLVQHGRVGRKGTWTFLRSELDRWLGTAP